MMNVLLIVNELKYACGVTNHILHLSRGLADTNKVKLWIICGGGKGIERFKDINIEIISDKRFLHKGRNITNYITAITYLAKFIKRNDIDIVHSHTHFAANIAKRASKITKVKTIQTNHGILQVKGRLKHFNADNYIAINEHISDYLLNNHIANEKNIHFIRCGIPVDSSPAIKPDNKINVLAASRFNYEKGLDIFIKAVSALDDIAKGKADFFIAGEGENESSLNQLNIKANAGIKFLGCVIDMYKLFQKTHIFVYPSRSKSEGFPAVITEAGASNCLVVSSDFEGVNSVVLNNIDGILFKTDDVKDLTEKLSYIINNYDSYSDYSMTFYNKVKKMFSLKTMIAEHINLYEECLR